VADDIVTLLRQVVSFDGGLAHVVDPLAADAADEIERLQRIIIELRAEVQRLQAVCTRDN
jgi:mannitol/fructose-specific phosphotransferase system IIA component